MLFNKIIIKGIIKIIKIIRIMLISTNNIYKKTIMMFLYKITIMLISKIMILIKWIIIYTKYNSRIKIFIMFNSKKIDLINYLILNMDKNN